MKPLCSGGLNSDDALIACYGGRLWVPINYIWLFRKESVCPAVGSMGTTVDGVMGKFQRKFMHGRGKRLMDKHPGNKNKPGS